MTLDVLAVAEPMIDIYHEPISAAQLREIGLEQGKWREYDPEQRESRDILAKVLEIPVTKKVPGSSPGNVAFSMAALGHSLGIVTGTGSDENGARYKRHIERYGICNLAQEVPGENSFVHVLFTSGERTFFGFTGNSDRVQLGHLPQARFLYTSGFEVVKLGTELTNFARGYRRKVILDVASPDIIEQNPDGFAEMAHFAHVLFASREEYQALFGRPFDDDHPSREIDESGTDIVVLKLGKEGSRIITRDNDIYVAANNIAEGELVNTNGAGDAYAAGFVSALLEGRDLRTAARNGTNIAATILKQDDPHLPVDYLSRRSAIDKFVRTYTS